MPDEIRKSLHNAYEHAKPYCGQGRVADYIPALAEVDPSKFGMAVVLPNGEYYCIGDADEPFSCLLYTSPSPRDKRQSRMPSSA